MKTFCSIFLYRIVNGKGICMYYEKTIKSEDADWVLFIHGLGGSIATWKYQMNAFSDYNILCVDLQGHGKSAFVKTNHPENIAANDIHDILLQEGIESVHIVALSLGTIIAMEFACLYPDNVKSMTLAGFVLNLNLKRKTLLLMAEAVKYILPVKWTYSMFARLIMPKENHKLSREIFVKESLKMTKQSFIAWINILMSSQKRMKEYIKNINTKHFPVLFVTGAEDYIFKNGVHLLRKKLHGCRFSFINRCGHVCSIDKKEQFNTVVLSFLSANIIAI